ncbi:MAG: DUF2069 domain-containing protein [Acidiferrobacterales bacterium]
MTKVLLKRAVLGTYFALLLLILLWEGWLSPAPNIPPATWIILKCVPLLLPLRGLLRGQKRAYLLTALLLMLYFIDGVVLTYLHWSTGFAFNQPLPYAMGEWVISTACFTFALLYIRKAGN